MTENRAASRFIRTAYDEEALREAVQQCREHLGANPSVACVQMSSDWLPRLPEVVEIVRVFGHTRHVIGSTASGFVSVGEDTERVSGCSVMLLHLPDTELDFSVIRSGDADHFRVPAAAKSGDGAWVTWCNPFLAHGERWMARWNGQVAHESTFGGLASGSNGQDSTAVFLNGETKGVAAVAMRLRGGVRLRGVVSQGCRPIGSPYTVTGVRRNVVVSIGSRKAFSVLEEAFEDLDRDEKKAAPGNLFAGLALDEYREDFGRGDFLVRNILGADPEKGVALGAFPRSGQTLQFQVRDKAAADADLRRLCLETQGRDGVPFAGFLFSCTGRGSGMFGVPNHDARVVEDTFGRIPMGGFLGNGEVGPVAGHNYLHGYTASTAFLYPA